MGQRGSGRGVTPRRAAFVLALALASVFASRARAEEPDLSARVEALLTAGIEPGAAHGTIVALGEPGARALQRVFENQSAPRYVRLRALTVLASFESKDSALYFEALVRAASASASASLDELHPARSSLVLYRALEGLAASAHWLDSSHYTDALTACLGHADAHVRKAAARLLEALDDDPSGKIDRALSARLASEPSSMVRSSMQRALTSRSARSRAPR